jgi:Uma2 family endonuclease
MAARHLPRISPEEYLAMERGSEARHEYYAGQPYAMAGGSYAHALVIANLCGELRNALRGKPCRALSSELLFRAGSGRLYAYPDVMVFCGPVEFADERQDVALNPIVVAEVLSPATEAFDRGRKAAEFRKSESLQQYLPVSQDEALVEIHTRDTDGLWKISEVSGMDGVCELASIGVAVSLRELYGGVELAAALG